MATQPRYLLRAAVGRTAIQSENQPLVTLLYLLRLESTMPILPVDRRSVVGMFGVSWKCIMCNCMCADPFPWWDCLSDRGLWSGVDDFLSACANAGVLTFSAGTGP